MENECTIKMEVFMFRNFREWLSDNLRYIILGLAIILILVAVGFAIVFIKGVQGEDKKPKETKAIQESIAETETQETQLQTESESQENDQIDEETATQIGTLVQGYYEKVSKADIDGLKTIVDEFDDTDAANITQMKEKYVEDYQNVSIKAIKKGPQDKSYIAFVYYELKLKNVDTPAPSLSTVYIVTEGDGQLHISKNDSDESIKTFIQDLRKEEEIKGIEQDVEGAYKAAREKDSNLDALFSGTPAKEETSKNSETTATEPETTAEMQTNKVVTTTDVCNVRADSRPDAELLGTVNSGSQITRVKTLDNGWSEVKFGDRTGYILSEYLQE